MKKIALLLALAMAFATTVTAADVTVGAWLDTRGDITTKGGDDNKNKDKDDTTLGLGSYEFELGASVAEENFGARIGLLHWSAANGNQADAPVMHNSYIYVDLVPSMVKFYAGIQMFAFGNYTSYAAVDGYGLGGAMNHWSDADTFGLGLGAYNYAGHNGFNRKPTGAALEIKPIEGLSLIAIADIKSASVGSLKLEDAAKNNLHFNAKYDHELFTIYTGYSTADKDKVNAQEFSKETKVNDKGETVGTGLGVKGAFYVEASTKISSELTADIKLESILHDDSDNQMNVISANLGYDFGAVRVASEINQYLQGGDTSADRATSQTVVGISVAPKLEIVNLKLQGLVSTDNRDDSDLAYIAGVKIAKSFGQATTNLGARYQVNSDDDNQFVVDWKVTCWF